MVKYPKYTTTVIGAYSVPDWYEALDRLVAVGQLSMGAMADAQYRAGEAAIHDQELAGIDVITGGEMHRRTHNRHSPPNAMLNYFWQKIPAFQGGTRPKPITPHDPDVFHPAATCRDRITETLDLGLVEEFRMVSALSSRPVKITMTGPHMLAKVAFDEHYNDLPRMMADIGKLLRSQFQASCRSRMPETSRSTSRYSPCRMNTRRCRGRRRQSRDRGICPTIPHLDAPYLPGQLCRRERV